MKITWRVISREGEEEEEEGPNMEKVQGIRSLNGNYKTDGGVGKKRIGNVKTQELVCMTQAHEFQGVGCRWDGGCKAERKKEQRMGEL